MSGMDWPQKQRELHNHHFDSTIWNAFAFRDDDVVISTYAKSGTTWMQQIVAELISDGAGNLPVSMISPWVDLRIPPAEVKLAELEAQTHRRFVKTHLPVDALVYSPKAKYIYIGRDGRDVVWSLYNHHATANANWYAALNDTPGRVGPPIEPPPADIRLYFHEWLDRDGYPFWSLWDNVRSWWAIRDLSNLLLVHFADLRKDPEREIRRIADFLELAPSRWDAIFEHTSFDYMKRHANQVVPLGGVFWNGGAETFIHKGTNGRWRDMLSPEQSAAYEARARLELGETCANWLANGSRAGCEAMTT